MTIENPMFPAKEIETYDTFSVLDTFCEVLARIERIGSCRRLVFAVTERHCNDRPSRAIVAKLVLPAEMMTEIAQMIAADRPELGNAFARLPIDAVAH
jgi:hypothetical protein